MLYFKLLFLAQLRVKILASYICIRTFIKLSTCHSVVVLIYLPTCWLYFHQSKSCSSRFKDVDKVHCLWLRGYFAVHRELAKAHVGVVHPSVTHQKQPFSSLPPSGPMSCCSTVQALVKSFTASRGSIKCMTSSYMGCYSLPFCLTASFMWFTRPVMSPVALTLSLTSDCT